MERLSPLNSSDVDWLYSELTDYTIGSLFKYRRWSLWNGSLLCEYLRGQSRFDKTWTVQLKLIIKIIFYFWSNLINLHTSKNVTTSLRGIWSLCGHTAVYRTQHNVLIYQRPFKLKQSSTNLGAGHRRNVKVSRRLLRTVRAI